MGRGLNEHGITVKQKAIYEHLKENPGTGFSELIRELKLGNGTAQYSIDELRRRGLVRRDYDGRLTRLYALPDTNGIMSAEGRVRQRAGHIPDMTSSEY